MPGLLIVAALIAAALPAVFLTHALLCRSAGAASRPGQGPAAAAALLTLLAFAALVTALEWGTPHGLPTVLYTMTGVAAATFAYFTMFCVTESGRRYHVLQRLLAQPTLTEEELRTAYSKEYIVRKRLDRMHAWGTIEVAGGRLRLRKRTAAWGARVFAGWGRLLGFPAWSAGNSSSSLHSVATSSGGGSSPPCPPVVDGIARRLRHES